MAARKPKAAEPAKHVAKPYEPTEREREVVGAVRERAQKRPPAPRLSVTRKGDAALVDIDHPDPRTGSHLLMEALGSTDGAFIEGMMLQLADVCGKGAVADERTLNFMLSAIRGVGPKDEVESMLAAQMAAVHMATMTFAKRLAMVENIPQQDSAEKAFNKLTRTFTAQVEALKRYRTGGEQKMTVEHVTVNDGGQAIVGNVSGRVAEKK
jgi:hypothetical protein